MKFTVFTGTTAELGGWVEYYLVEGKTFDQAGNWSSLYAEDRSIEIGNTCEEYGVDGETPYQTRQRLHQMAGWRE